jgi:uncharacterized protein YecT (DUF1311 family)
MSSLLLVALAIASSPGDYPQFRISQAQTDRITSADYKRCMTKAVGNSDEAQCIREEWDHLDKLLNAEYRAAMASMPNRSARDRLRAAQRQWLQGSQQECFEEMQEVGHTPYEVALHHCEMDELVRRIAWFTRLKGR